LGFEFLGAPTALQASTPSRLDGARMSSLVTPLYRLSASEIEDRIAATYDKIMEQTRMSANQFVWNSISSIEELGELRMAAMSDFLSDYTAGKAQGRYLEAQLPELPFPRIVIRSRHLLSLSISLQQTAWREIPLCGRSGDVSCCN
jgi:hypothetical protein